METQSLKDCVVNEGHFCFFLHRMFTIWSQDLAISVLPPDDAVTRHVCRRAEKARLAEKIFGRPGLAEFFLPSPGLAEKLAEKPAD